MMMGAPGSGKSTFAKTHMVPHIEEYISRDEVRFSIVNEDEEYFSKEDEVFRQYVNKISRALAYGATVWADATHLNVKSRLKLLNALTFAPDEIEIIYINTSLEDTLDQNEKRFGTRAFVPESAVIRMWRSIQEPEFHEGNWTYNKIYIVEKDKPIIVKVEG